METKFYTNTTLDLETAEMTINGQHDRISGYLNIWLDARYETKCEAEAIAAKFPKFVKAHTTRLSTLDAAGNRIEVYQISTGFTIPNKSGREHGVVGAVNETGIKRIRAWFKTAATI